MYTTLRKELSKEAKISGSSPSDNSSGHSDNSYSSSCEGKKRRSTGGELPSSGSNKNNNISENRSKKRTKLIFENHSLQQQQPTSNTTGGMKAHEDAADTLIKSKTSDAFISQPVDDDKLNGISSALLKKQVCGCLYGEKWDSQKDLFRCFARESQRVKLQRLL
jgi:hypothetical protein